MPVVNMPDGTPVSFPDQMPPDQIKALIVQKFPDVVKSVSPQPIETGNGFISRVSNDYNKRNTLVNNSREAYNSGDQTGAETIMQSLGQVGLLANDVVGEGMKSVAPVLNAAISHTPLAIPQKIGSYVLNSVADSNIGNAAKTGFNNVEQAYNNFSENNPRAARNIEGMAGIGSVLAALTPVKGVSAVGAATDLTAQGVRGAGSGVLSALESTPMLDNALGKTVRPAASDLKNVSRANYARAEQLGGNLNADFTNRFLNKVDSYAPQNKWVAANSKAKLSSSLSEDWAQFRNNPMTLDDATSIDQHLTDLLDHSDATDKHNVLNSQGREILDIKNSLRESLLKAADDGHIEGGREGLDAYRTAVKDWAAQSQISEIQRIIDRAGSMDNPATALKTGFRNIAYNPGRLSKYPKDVQAAITRAANSGDVSNILRTNLGSRLISTTVGGIAGSAAGPVGVIAGSMAGAAASRATRGMAESMQLGRANNVIDKIAAKSSMPTERVPLSQMIKRNKTQAVVSEERPVNPLLGNQLLLPSPGNMSAIPMSAEEIAISQAKMRQASGMTGGLNRTEDLGGTAIVGNVVPQNQRALLPAPGVRYGNQLDETGINQAQAGIRAASGETGGIPVSEGYSGNSVSRVKSISKDQIAKRFSKEWDMIDADSQQMITDQINAAWASQKMPLSDIIAQAQKDITELSLLQGKPKGSIADAMSRAKAVKGKK